MKPIKTEKKLQLAKQTLRTLSNETLGEVAGGASLYFMSCDESCGKVSIQVGWVRHRDQAVTVAKG